jgi:hypothetical protein
MEFSIFAVWWWWILDDDEDVSRLTKFIYIKIFSFLK